MADPSDGTASENRDQDISQDAMTALTAIKERVSKAIHARGPMEKRQNRSGLGNAHGVGTGLPKAAGGKPRLIIYVLTKMDPKDMKAALDSLLGQEVADTFDFDLHVTDVQKQQQWPGWWERPPCGSAAITPNPLGFWNDQVQPPRYVPGQDGWWPYGTLGATARDNQGCQWIISCNHVLAQNHSVPGPFNRWRDVHQPSRAPQYPDVIAQVIAAVPLDTGAMNLVDAAAARVVNQAARQGFIAPDAMNAGAMLVLEFGQPLYSGQGGHPVLQQGLRVLKSGPSSGITGGVLLSPVLDLWIEGNVIKPDNRIEPEWFFFVNQMQVQVAVGEGFRPNPNDPECFSIGGDSGSFVVDDLHRPIGMLIGGAGGLTTVTPLWTVQNQLQMAIEHI